MFLPGYLSRYRFRQGYLPACSQMHKINLLEEKVMKKILMALILGLVFFPVTATAQTWVDPYVRKDGTDVEGRWESPKDCWQRSYSIGQGRSTL